jgi:uncharacterized protein YcbX
MALVSELHVYPVKSCAGRSLTEATLDRRGFAGDRGWMVVDETGTFISQRTDPRMSLVRTLLGANRLLLEAPGLPPLELPVHHTGPAARVTVFDDACDARDQGTAAAEWFSRHLGRPARLVRMDENFRRLAPSDPPAEVGFADAYPLLVLSEASLADLNGRLAQPVPMNRFRPNVVLAECEPFAEDTWKRIRIGDLVLTLATNCVRCVTTTVDQATGRTSKEPLATLATYRRADGGVIFGRNAAHLRTGRIRVGDEVEVLESNEPTSR